MKTLPLDPTESCDIDRTFAVCLSHHSFEQVNKTENKTTEQPTKVMATTATVTPAAMAMGGTSSGASQHQQHKQQQLVSSAVAPSSSLDFEALLSRDYQPARVAQLQLRPLPSSTFPSIHHHSPHQSLLSKKKRRRQLRRQQQQQQQLLWMLQQQKQQYQHHEQFSGAGSNPYDVMEPAEGDATTSSLVNAIKYTTSKGISTTLNEEQRDFVFKVIRQTPAYLKHLTPDEREKVLKEKGELLTKRKNKNNPQTAVSPQASTVTTNSAVRERIPPQFSPLELMDWESQIDWGDEEEGDAATDNNNTSTTETATTSPEMMSLTNGRGGGDENKKEIGNQNNSTHNRSNPTTNALVASRNRNLGYSFSNQNDKFLQSLSPLARQLLETRRNPFLDQLTFDDTIFEEEDNGNGQYISAAAAAAAAAPLILELGVAGQSVANKVYQSTMISAQHPTPAILQYAYQARVDREWVGAATAAAGRGGKNGANGDADASTLADLLDSELAKTMDTRKLTKQQLHALIEARSKKREQMAKDKTNRITTALGTLAAVMGGGKGRAITSSLMGPGGTERTGRPTRGVTGAGTLETEHMEQLDLVTSHSLVRDLSKVLLREFRRPKLPLAVVKQDLSWQFQIRLASNNSSGNNNNKHNGKDGGAGAGHYQQGSFHHHRSGMMMRRRNNMNGGPGGGGSIRTEADLSPSMGKLVVLEYSEERPPIQLNKGMMFKIVNYFRGDKAHCPVSAGGGDRPARRKRNDDSGSGGGGAGSGGGDGDSGSGGGGSGDDGERGGRGGTGGSGGGDRHGDGGGRLQDRLPRLGTSSNKMTHNSSGSQGNNILDWIGPLPKKSKDSSKLLSLSGENNKDRSSIDILPEGVTEILHPSVHGPFLGEVPEGSTLTGLISNLFVAPMFRHEADSTDFLMVLTPPSGAARAGHRDSMGVVLRDFPRSGIYAVGQTEPRTRVHAPQSPGEKAFTGPYISYQIARAITRAQAKEGHGLRLDDMQSRVLPNLELPGAAFRQRLKQVAMYDKNTQIWTTKPVGMEGYPGVEALGKSIAPEGVAAFETACAASRRLADLGIHQLFAGKDTAVSVGVAIVYMAGQLNACRELHRKLKRLVEISRSQRDQSSLQSLYYTKAADEAEAMYKVLRHKNEVAQFINEQLHLAPWNLTGEFIDVHKRAEGTGMMRLTGLGDPSGTGEGFSFLREMDAKPSKSVGNAALNAQVKKITGTEDDLRKLTMQQMASLLRSYGMAQKQIDTLKRWDRVHCIRDLSTKAASDGVGDGLERFARGEKLKLSEQKQMYRDRIQEIWRRQLAALTNSDSAALAGESSKVDGSSSGGLMDGGGGGHEASAAAQQAGAQPTKKTGAGDDSDSESDDDDDLADAFEQEMMDRAEANQLVAAHVGNNKESEAGLGQLRAAVTQDAELSKDARDLFALRRQMDEEKAAQEGLQASTGTNNAADALERHAAAMANRKVIRKRITKTYPDGRVTTTFRFILHPEEVGKIEARLAQKDNNNPKKLSGFSSSSRSRDDPSTRGGSSNNNISSSRSREWNYQYGDDEKPPGHAMFEDEDNFEYSGRGRSNQSGNSKRRGGGAGATGRKRGEGRTAPRQARGPLQFGKLKTKVSEEERMRKRKREEEELEVYTAQAKRKSTNNRRERGSIRDRRPHVMFSNKLESIRQAVEQRPFVGPFVKPVNRKAVPRYYEVISNPIDLQTIRDKIKRYDYRTADALLEDFELMKSNAIKFNGEGHHIATEAKAISEFVWDQIKASRAELSQLEVAVENQMDPKKGGVPATTNTTSALLAGGSGMAKKKRSNKNATAKVASTTGLAGEGVAAGQTSTANTTVASNSAAGTATAEVDVQQFMGDMQQYMDESDSGEDDEISLGL